MSQMCQTCGAKCCTYFCFEIDTPESYDEFEDIRWYLCHEDVTVHIDEGGWYLSVGNRCKMLAKDNLCTLYENRPLICRKYSTDNCEQTDGDFGYEELFETPEQLEAYALKTLGEAEFKKARARERKKLEPKLPVKKAKKKSK